MNVFSSVGGEVPGINLGRKERRPPVLPVLRLAMQNEGPTQVWLALHDLQASPPATARKSEDSCVSATVDAQTPPYPFRPEVHLCAPSSASLQPEQQEKIRLLRQRLERDNAIYRSEHVDLANNWAARQDISR